MKNSADKKILLFLSLLALVLRLSYLLLRDDKFILNWNDQYDEIAQNFLAGKGFCSFDNFGIGGGQPFYAFRCPLYPVFLIFCHLVVGNNFLAIKIIHCLLNALTIFVIYAIAKGIFGRKIGISAATVFAIFPPFIYHCAWLGSETLIIFLLALTIFLLLKGNRKNSYLVNIGSGVSLGLTILCRGEYAAFFPFVLIWQGLFSSSPLRWRKIITIFSFAILTILPWTLRNYLVTHTFIPLSTNGGMTFWASNSSWVKDDRIRGSCMPGEFPEIMEKVKEMSEVEVNSYFTRQTTSYIREKPLLYCKRVLSRFDRFWALFLHRRYYSYLYWLSSGITYIPLFFLAFIGALFAKEKQRDCSLFYFLFLSKTMVHMAIHAVLRYRLPIEPYFVILATAGFYLLKEKIKWQKGHLR